MLAKLLLDKEKLKPVEHTINQNGQIIYYYIYENEHSEYIFMTANTSREKESFFEFVRDLQLYWGIKCVIVEAIVDHRPNKGTKHRVVDFWLGKRNGEVFEEVIKKYGIPNTVFKHCTRELKQAPIRSFLKEIGWGSWKDYKTVIGYRADEPRRANVEKANKLNQWYPLWEWGIKKPDVAYFWNRQSFDLGIRVDAEGNCEDCFKKSILKIIYQVRTNPDGAEWINLMERKYSHFQPESRDDSKCTPPYYMFRDNQSLQDIIDDNPELMAMPIEQLESMLNDKSLSEDGVNFYLYEQDQCGDESCEPFTSEEELEDE